MANEVAQFVRVALNVRLPNNGWVALNLCHTTLVFHGHPDGRILGCFGGSDGVGVLAVRTVSANIFKRLNNHFIPLDDKEQIEVIT